MKKTSISALLLAAVIAFTPAAGCRFNSTKVDEESSSSSAAKEYAQMPEIGQNEISISLGENTTLNDTSYTLNGVIDSGREKDGLKYIYLDVTIRNESEKPYEMSGLNNFYLILDDGTEVLTDVRADIYAKQSLSGYEQLLNVAAGAEYNGYIGFCVDKSVDKFKVGFFATGVTDDKASVIFCDIAPEDITDAPRDMFTESE